MTTEVVVEKAPLYPPFAASLPKKMEEVNLQTKTLGEYISEIPFADALPRVVAIREIWAGMEKFRRDKAYARNSRPRRPVSEWQLEEAEEGMASRIRLEAVVRGISDEPAVKKREMRGDSLRGIRMTSTTGGEFGYDPELEAMVCEGGDGTGNGYYCSDYDCGNYTECLYGLLSNRE